MRTALVLALLAACTVEEEGPREILNPGDGGAGPDLPVLLALDLADNPDPERIPQPALLLVPGDDEVTLGLPNGTATVAPVRWRGNRITLSEAAQVDAPPAPGAPCRGLDARIEELDLVFTDEDGDGKADRAAGSVAMAVLCGGDDGALSIEVASAVRSAPPRDLEARIPDPVLPLTGTYAIYASEPLSLESAEVSVGGEVTDAFVFAPDPAPRVAGNLLLLESPSTLPPGAEVAVSAVVTRLDGAEVPLRATATTLSVPDEPRDPSFATLRGWASAGVEADAGTALTTGTFHLLTREAVPDVEEPKLLLTAALAGEPGTFRLRVGTVADGKVEQLVLPADEPQTVELDLRPLRGQPVFLQIDGTGAWRLSALELR